MRWFREMSLFDFGSWHFSFDLDVQKYTPDDQEWPSDLPEHFVDIGKDWRNTPFIIRPAAYQGLLGNTLKATVYVNLIVCCNPSFYNLLSCFLFFFADLCWAVCINRSVESAFNLLDDGRNPWGFLHNTWLTVSINTSLGTLPISMV